MDLNTNRLNFPLMVDNNLKVTPKLHSLYFDSYANTNTNTKRAKKRPSSKNFNSKTTANITDIEDSLGSIYYTIHNSLKNSNMHRQNLKQIIAQSQDGISTKEVPTAIVNSNTNNNESNNTSNKMTNIKSIKNNKGQNKTKSKGNKYNSSIYNKFKFNNYNNNKSYLGNFSSNNKPMSFKTTNAVRLVSAPGKNNNKLYDAKAKNLLTRSKTIPQATLNCEKKRRQMMAHSINSYQMHQREVEVLRQKQILEGMLQEHKILETNRQRIKQEIQSMKIFINEIRDKLDKSLLKLSEKKTVYRMSHSKSPLTTTVALKKTQNNKGGRNNSPHTLRANNQPTAGIVKH